MYKKSFFLRALEFLPGTLTWGSFISAPILAYFHPAFMSMFIILFDLYWLLKGANVAIHLMHSYYELKAHNSVDWQDWLIRLKNPASFQQYLEQNLASAPNRRIKSFY